MIRRLLLASVLLTTLGPSIALAADPIPEPTLYALDAAPTRPAGSWSIGVFAPLRYALSDNLEVELPPLVSLVSPTVGVRFAHLKGSNFALTGEYGVSVPTYGLRLTRGYFFPTGEDPGQIGWYAVPRVGLVGSVVSGDSALLTGKLDFATGIPVGGQTTVHSLDSFLAPVELMSAPVLRGFRTHLGAGYDRSLRPWLRVRTSLDGYLVGPEPEGFAQSSPWFFSAFAGIDLRVGRQSRFTLGGIWWNWDQFATEVRTDSEGFAKRVRVRSNDFLPTIDFIWAG